MIMVNILVSQITCTKATWHVMPFYNCSSWNIVKGIICLDILSTEINVIIVTSHPLRTPEMTGVILIVTRPLKYI